MITNINLPSFDGLGDMTEEKQRKKLMSYLHQLTEQLKYVLGNLDSDNFIPQVKDRIDNAADIEEVDKVREQSERDFRKALAEIVQTSDEITIAYQKEIAENADSITSSVSANYALKNDLSKSIASVQSSVKQNTDSIQATVTQTAALQDKLGDFNYYTFSSYIRYDQDGLTLGKSDSDFKCVITNTKLSFYNGTAEIAYVSGNKLYIRDANVTGTLSLGNSGTGYYDFVLEANQSISIVYRGGNS